MAARLAAHGLRLPCARGRRRLARARSRRIRRWCPTRSASRPPGRSSPSGWARNYPFHHPRYAGQMLKPPHPVAIAAYTAALHVNANNHALDGGPETSAMEVEVMAWLAEMFGFPAECARPPDLERDDREPRGAVGRAASCTRARRSSTAPTRTTPTRGCARVLGLRAFEVPADVVGRLDMDAVEALCAAGEVGTVVVTAGSTGDGHGRRRRARGGAARALRRPRARGRRLRRVLHAAGQAVAAAGARGAVPGDRAGATASSSTRTSTACSPTGAARCCSATRASGGSTSTTRPTRTSPPATCTWARSRLECSRAGAVGGRAVADAAGARPRADPRRGRARRAERGRG